MTTLTKNEIKKFATKRGETAHYSGKLKKFFFRKFSNPPIIDIPFNQPTLTPRQELTRKRKRKK